MKVWIIADTHFGHKNIIEYCNRPWNYVKEMDSALIKKWNKKVKKNDIIYVLGDFALGKKEEIKYYLSKLNGRKFLVMGNHDGYSYKFYLEAGFEKVYDKPIIIQDFIILSHAPKFIESTLYANIYGHVHDDQRYLTHTSHTYCVSVERINYEPILLDEILNTWAADKIIKEGDCKENV